MPLPLSRETKKELQTMLFNEDSIRNTGLVFLIFILFHTNAFGVDHKASTSLCGKIGIIKMSRHPYISADNYNPGISLEALILRNSSKRFSWGMDLCFSRMSPIKDTTVDPESWGWYQIYPQYSIFEILPTLRVYYLQRYLFLETAIGFAIHTLESDFTPSESDRGTYPDDMKETEFGETFLLGLGYATGTNPNMGVILKAKFQHHWGIPPEMISFGGDFMIDFSF